jgi:hypothetical protein
MSMSLIVHMLEVCVTVLSAMLAWQVARQYKYYQVQQERLVGLQARSSHSESPFDLASPAENKFDQVVEAPKVRKEPVVPEVAVSEESEAVSTSQILDDYIGGFFDSAVKTEIEMKAFRSLDEQEVENYYRSDAGNDHVSSVAPAIDLSKYKASSVDAADKIPVLKTPIPESLITERFLEQMKELDEEVILVEGEQEPVVARDNVMSDKVVLAMLGEAKLVGSN